MTGRIALLGGAALCALILMRFGAAAAGMALVLGVAVFALCFGLWLGAECVARIKVPRS